jgi:hypothetical protein
LCREALQPDPGNISFSGHQAHLCLPRQAGSGVIPTRRATAPVGQNDSR